MMDGYEIRRGTVVPGWHIVDTEREALGLDHVVETHEYERDALAHLKHLGALGELRREVARR